MVNTGASIEPLPRIKSSFSDYPETLDRVFNNFSMTKMFGACYFAMGPIITLITLLTEIVKEKEFRLRNGLNVVGVGHNVYWFTWILVAVLINAG